MSNYVRQIRLVWVVVLTAMLVILGACRKATPDASATLFSDENAAKLYFRVYSNKTAEGEIQLSGQLLNSAQETECLLSEVIGGTVTSSNRRFPFARVWKITADPEQQHNISKYIQLFPTRGETVRIVCGHEYEFPIYRITKEEIEMYGDTKSGVVEVTCYTFIIELYRGVYRRREVELKAIVPIPF